MTDVEQLARPDESSPPAKVVPYTFTLRLIERGDGGADVRSPEMKGLLAGAKDIDWMWRSLAPSLERLLLNNAKVRLAGPIDLGPTPTVAPGETVERRITVKRYDPS